MFSKRLELSQRSSGNKLRPTETLAGWLGSSLFRDQRISKSINLQQPSHEDFTLQPTPIQVSPVIRPARHTDNRTTLNRKSRARGETRHWAHNATIRKDAK